MDETKKATLKSLILFLLISSFTFELEAAENYCQAQLRVLSNACDMLLLKKSPSADCCLRIRRIPMQCVCPKVTPEIAKLADVKYVVGIIRQCGRSLASGTKCGSVTVP